MTTNSVMRASALLLTLIPHSPDDEDGVSLRNVDGFKLYDAFLSTRNLIELVTKLGERWTCNVCEYNQSLTVVPKGQEGNVKANRREIRREDMRYINRIGNVPSC
jgi:hypothetical protein